MADQTSSPLTDPGGDFKLGLFSFNHYGGLTMTLAESRWDASWANMSTLARRSEAAGLDFLLPLAGWQSHNGDAPTDGHSHESLTWAAGLLAVTTTIPVFATVHVPFIDPVFAAKQAVTCHHIGNGRFGLNVVAGYNKSEFELFDVDFLEHDERYRYLDEWLSVVETLWSGDGPIDFVGEHFTRSGLWAGPPPVDGVRPMIISAGSSPIGRRFAADRADALFMIITNIDRLADEVRAARAMRPNSSQPIYASGHVFCKQTAAETREYYEYLVHEKGDHAAGQNMLRGYEEIKSVPEAVLKQPEFLDRLVSGHGTFPIVGDPDHVVSVMERVSDSGVNGMAIALPNYLDDLDVLVEEILPRMEARGLRVSRDRTHG